MNTIENKIKQAFSVSDFRENGHALIDMLADNLETSLNEKDFKTFNYRLPEDELAYWLENFSKKGENNFAELSKILCKKAMDFHSKGYMGHQISVTLPITALTSAIVSYFNNCTTVYEVGMFGNAMEKIVLTHLAEKFGYDEKSTGVVTSGGSLGNLTALLTARESSGIDEKDFADLAIMASQEAHYSIERAAKIMGIKSENVLKIPVDENFHVRTDLLEDIYTKAIQDGKKVFCIVGCANTTAVGVYDDLTAIGNFAAKHDIWFHADGAHGAAAIFSDKYKHLLKGIELSDSLMIDFHKMMFAPPLSTAVLYNNRDKKLKEFSPEKASYLWQNQQTHEWYNSAKHTFECTKPTSILHTYAIMKLYGDEIYQQHIDYLYDLGTKFAKMVKAQDNMELAVEPECNIVCFRYIDGKSDDNILNQLNKKIYEALSKDGTFYIVNTNINNKLYLRVSLMNPLTTVVELEKLLTLIQNTICEF